ncbi:MAG: hypothetical protein Alis3KO_37700 [Aliiglaciecola sp.]
MKISRLAFGLTLSLLTVSAANAAKYRVVELPVSNEGVNSFSVAINERGEIASTVRLPFNPPIDVDIINFESEFLIRTLTDVSATAVGNINRDDRVILYNFITDSANANNPFSQQIAQNQSFLINGNDIEPVTGFDVIDRDLEGLTKSADTIVRGINNSTAMVGVAEAPFLKVDYRNENGTNLTYHYQEHLERGFLDINGQAFPVLPDEDFLGGISEANDINNSFEIAGMGTVEVIEPFETLAENCEDSTSRGDVHYEFCIRSLYIEYQDAVNRNIGNGVRPADSTFKRRAMIWEFNPQGEMLDSRELGVLADPVPGDNRFFGSRAVAINNNGIAVGASDVYFQENANIVVEQAVVFDSEEVVGFIDDQDYFQSIANDINDNDIVVGFGTRNINGTPRTKFFVHDYRGEFTTFPDDFFDSSSSVAHAINNNGIVVGEAEIDSDLIGIRRRVGFLYDVNTEEFTDINTLLGCDSPYTIVQGNDINDNGEISATAVIFREGSDITGELALDERGNTIFQSNTVAVQLVPIPGGNIDDCQLQVEVVERKGGSSLFMLPILGLVLLLRRRLFKH